MATEALLIPERHIPEVIKVIRTGLSGCVVDDDVRENLMKWCDEEEAYMKRLAEGE